jgi:hypothetical protein
VARIVAIIDLKSGGHNSGMLRISGVLDAAEGWLGGEHVVDAPLRRKEQADRLGGRDEAGLDAFGGAGQFGGRAVRPARPG